MTTGEMAHPLHGAKRSYSAGSLIVSAILLFVSVVMILPVVWMISTSFKSTADIWNADWIPHPFTMEHYALVLQRIPVIRMILNSFFVSLISTLAQLLIGALAAYSFARINFRGKNLVFMLFLGTMMIPLYILIIPLYLIVDRFGMVNTYFALILPRLVSVFAIFMLRQFFMTIPRALDESAFMEGAGRLRVLFLILVPLSKPAFAALFIFSFMGMWNDFLWPLLVTNSETMRTIQVGIAYFKDSNVMDYGATMAVSFMASIPILIVFLIANRSFVQGITMTGIKG